MKILVLGATGFLGQHLVPLLVERGHQVVPAGLRSVTSDVIKVDITDASSVATALDRVAPDGVINLAGSGLPRPNALSGDSWRVNDLGSRAVASELVRLSDPPILVHAASALELEPEDLALDYAQSKAVGSAGVRDVLTGTACRYAVVRIHNVYGPGQPAGRFVGDLIAALNSGQHFVVKHPSRKRDFCFVDDVVEHLADLVAMPVPPADVEIGYGTRLSLRHVAETAVACSGADHGLVSYADDSREAFRPPLPVGAGVSTFLKCRTSLVEGFRRIAEMTA